MTYIWYHKDMKSDRRWAIWSKQEQSSYFRELKPYLIASVLLILAAMVYGAATSAYAPKFSSRTGETLQEFNKLFLGLSKPNLAMAIFINNGLKTLAVIVVGTLGGILPLVFLLVNGYVLGVVLDVTIRSEGALAAFLAIAPHGTLELPAIMLGTSIGLRLGVHGLKRLVRSGESTLTAELARGLKFFLIVILPLLLLSAFIEAFVTAAAVSRL
jgi:stage II sporulation protein M